MAKVLVVATSCKTRGGITSVVKAHECGEQWKEFSCEWIETHIDGSPWQKVRYFLSGLTKFFAKIRKTDLVHIHMAAVERKMPFVFITHLLRKKLIIHLHFPDPDTTIYDKVKSRRYKWCLSKADKVVVLSHSWEELIKEEWGITNTTVIYNPCPNIIPEPHYEINKKEQYILYAGNLSIRKGYKDLLKAFANAHTQTPQWNIVFAGNGEIEKAKILAEEIGIANKVRFTGWISGKDKDVFFRNASAFCLPSYAEGFPMGVLDAWAYNLPVITTPVGGLAEILQDHQNALVFNPGDIEKLSNCLIEITKPEIREMLSQQSEILAKDKFSVKEIDRQVGNLYSDVLKYS